MHIVVCIKPTPDPAEIHVLPDGAIQAGPADWVLSHFDLHALEAGLQLAELYGGTLTALSAAPKMVNQPLLQKDILARGASRLIVAADDALIDAEPHQTAVALSAAVRRLAPVDLVLCGEGSADLYSQQTAFQLAEGLGWPVVNYVQKVWVESDHIRVERLLEHELEVLELPLPAVLSMTSGINTPRLPSIRSILLASQKKAVIHTLSDLGMAELPPRSAQILAYRQAMHTNRRGIRLEGTAAESAAALLQSLNRDGISIE